MERQGSRDVEGILEKAFEVASRLYAGEVLNYYSFMQMGFSKHQSFRWVKAVSRKLPVKETISISPASLYECKGFELLGKRCKHCGSMVLL